MSTLGPVLSLVLIAASLACADTMREFETSTGLVRIAVLSEDTAAAIDSAAALQGPTPSQALANPTSLSGVSHRGDALLEVYFIDKVTGKELRFPLKYTQLRSFLLLHPLAYQQGSVNERAVAFVRNLSDELRISMKDNVPEEEKE